MDKKLLLEAISLLERKRDHLLLRDENKVRDKEINEFIERASECLKK